MTTTSHEDQFTSPPPDGIIISDNTKTQHQKPLPCPFCGAEMNISEQGNLGHPQGECVVVAILIAYHSGFIPEKSKLIDLWNRSVTS